MQKPAARSICLFAAPSLTSAGDFGASAFFGFSGTWRLAGWQPSFSGSYSTYYGYYRWQSSSLPS